MRKLLSFNVIFICFLTLSCKKEVIFFPNCEYEKVFSHKDVGIVKKDSLISSNIINTSTDTLYIHIAGGWTFLNSGYDCKGEELPSDKITNINVFAIIESDTMNIDSIAFFGNVSVLTNLNGTYYKLAGQIYSKQDFLLTNSTGVPGFIITLWNYTSFQSADSVRFKVIINSFSSKENTNKISVVYSKPFFLTSSLFSKI